MMLCISLVFAGITLFTGNISWLIASWGIAMYWGITESRWAKYYYRKYVNEVRKQKNPC